MTTPDFDRLVRAYLDILEDRWSRRLRTKQELLTIARDGTVSYSYTFSDYLRVSGVVLPEPPVLRPWSTY